MFQSNSALVSLILMVFGNSNVYAFTGFKIQTTRPCTFLNLEDDIADMIDNELIRLYTKDQVDEIKRQRTQKALTPELPRDFDFQFDEEIMANDKDSLQMVKDRRLAEKDPARYCADRCVSTGYCDVFEEFFDFSAQEVLAFCTECVLSDDEEPCDVPDKFYDGDDGKGLRP
mmetsp:Transcript_38070/g.46481  ORF Transcript_38070/g.46481 Transcript_38070/m.46481 type:complete len:172 (-) Transcript_38070:88-603(-)|eukprot:CAMPEP_0172514462 /NCGR_PEP_ID=MMETSP1066-20121228/260253_1 /TAXON_ID=671091 /ORGANISM="Coscinodiscus wailesii, Strain CCMP2513" /LENGTH=171 /DNA_ID=CAMNT_0013295135 /DNA_START=82 /DNA_END=597 /DNA_ORIENTATION=-